MKGFKSILYVSEPRAEQESAVARAAMLAENNQAGLTVMEVIPEFRKTPAPPPGHSDFEDMRSAMIAERRQALEALVAPHQDRKDIRLEVLQGREFLEVIRAVLRDGHDLVIKPAENPSFTERLFGGNDMHLLRKCPCPVWLTKPEANPKYDCIVSAVDFDPSIPDSIDGGINNRILELASSLALSEFAALHIVHAWDAPGEMLLRTWSDNPDETIKGYLESNRAHHQAGMNRLRDSLRTRIGREAFEYLAPRFHLIQGSASRVIPQVAHELKADLIVMGTIARAGIPGFFIGNTAEAILDQLQCSVLAVKPPDFVSPVTLPVDQKAD